MELVFKLPKGKLPFMGIVFEKEFPAARTNQELVHDYKNCEFIATLEPVNNNQFNLVLKCLDPVLKYEYKNLEFKYDSFLRWMPYANASEINFSHLIIKNSEHVVVKTSQQHKLFVIKIRQVSLIGERII